MDTLFSMALQCQVKDAFSATQNKSEAMKVHSVCAGEWSSMLNIVSCVHNFFSLFPIAKLSDFVLLNHLATVFSLKDAKWRLGIFFNFEPCDRS